jgi:hypothetical protein
MLPCPLAQPTTHPESVAPSPITCPESAILPSAPDALQQVREGYCEYTVVNALLVLSLPEIADLVFRQADTVLVATRGQIL